jgi:(2Fe-2S) ferredoxin
MHEHDDQAPHQQSVNTRRHALGQLVICNGCCCGHTDKGRPGLPEERLKTTWKKERLLKTIQLTISGCLGPCDVANVVQVITPDGIEWYGKIDQDRLYDALIEWARACHRERKLLPRPSALEAYRFEGFIAYSA